MTEAEHLARCADIPLTLACLVVMGANKYDVTLRSLRADGRMKHLVRVRWEIAAAARRYSFSFPAIGRALNRDHTTVMHGLAMWRKTAQKKGTASPEANRPTSATETPMSAIHIPMPSDGRKS